MAREYAIKLGRSFLERVIPNVMRAAAVGQYCLREDINDPSKHGGRIDLKKLIPLAMIEITSNTGLPTGSSYLLAELLVRTVISSLIKEEYILNTELISAIDDFAARISDASESVSDRDERLAQLLREAIISANSLQPGLRGIFLAVVMGVVSSFSADAIKITYKELISANEISAPAYVPGTELVVTGDGLRIREGPHLRAEILGLLSLNSKVVFHGNLGDWYLVSLSDQKNSPSGWVHREFVTKLE